MGRLTPPLCQMPLPPPSLLSFYAVVDGRLVTYALLQNGFNCESMMVVEKCVMGVDLGRGRSTLRPYIVISL